MATTMPLIDDTDSLASLEERITRAVELVSQLRQERDAAVARADSMAAHQTSAQAEIETALADREDARRALAEVEQQNARLTQEIESLKTERKQVRGRIEKLLSQLDSLSR